MVEHSETVIWGRKINPKQTESFNLFFSVMPEEISWDVHMGFENLYLFTAYMKDSRLALLPPFARNHKFCMRFIRTRLWGNFAQWLGGAWGEHSQSFWAVALCAAFGHVG